MIMCPVAAVHSTHGGSTPRNLLVDRCLSQRPSLDFGTCLLLPHFARPCGLFHTDSPTQAPVIPQRISTLESSLPPEPHTITSLRNVSSSPVAQYLNSSSFKAALVRFYYITLYTHRVGRICSNNISAFKPFPAFFPF